MFSTQQETNIHTTAGITEPYTQAGQQYNINGAQPYASAMPHHQAVGDKQTLCTHSSFSSWHIASSANICMTMYNIIFQVSNQQNQNLSYGAGHTTFKKPGNIDYMNEQVL